MANKSMEKRIAAEFQQHLLSNDPDSALQCMANASKSNLLSPAVYDLMSLFLYQYMDIAFINQTRSKQLEKLINLMIKRCPGSTYALDAMVVYCSEILHDNIAAYVYVQRIKERCIGQLNFPACVHAYQTCFALHRSDEAAEWLMHAHKCARAAEEKQICEEAKCKLLADRGQHAEAAELAKALLPTTGNPLKMHRNVSLWYYQAASYDYAYHHADIALNMRRDLQSLLRIAHITYAMNQYEKCLAFVHEALAMIETEYNISLDATAEENHAITKQSDIARDHIEHFVKLAIKTSIKMRDSKSARLYLFVGKRILPWYGVWDDIEDLWIDETRSLESIVQEQYVAIRDQYAFIPDGALNCIARAEAIFAFLGDPSLWYDTICREYGVAFEIILRDRVCQGSKHMHLDELIDYISGLPGDPLYGGNALLHTLRHIRNDKAHGAVADADDARNSRRILFEEVLAKLK